MDRRARERERKRRQKQAALADSNLALAQSGTLPQSTTTTPAAQRPSDHEAFYGKAPSVRKLSISSSSSSRKLGASSAFQTPSRTNHNNTNNHHRYSGDDDSDSSGSCGREALLQLAKQRATQPKEQQRSSTVTTASTSAATDLIRTRYASSSDDEETPPLRTASSMVRNPLLWEKEQRNAAAAAASTMGTPPVDRSILDASLWEENDDDDDDELAKKGGKRRTKGSNPLQNSSPLKIAQRRKRKNPSTPSKSKRLSKRMGALSAAMDTSVEDDESCIDLLKPTFEWAQFGPFALEPLRLHASTTAGLTKTQDSNDAAINQEQQQGPGCYAVPASIARYLPDYQRKGIEFMFKALQTEGGAILGDDMGLGKTIQVVALIAAYMGKTGTEKDRQSLEDRQKAYREYECEQQRRRDQAMERGTILLQEQEEPPPTFAVQEMYPILVVIPAGVVDNWAAAFRTWGHFSVVEFRNQGREERLQLVTRNLAEVTLCPESVFQRESDVKILNTVKWKLVIIDEFHKFKNKVGKWSDHLRAMKQSIGCKVLGLTGTVMQNNLKELWNLVDLAKGGILGSYDEFEEVYEKPIKLARAKGASKEMIQLGKQQALKMSLVLNRIYLKRTKETVLKDSLPEKEELAILCELSDIQKQLYQHILSMPDFLLLTEARGPCDCGVNKKFFLEYQSIPKSSTRARIDYVRRNKKLIKTRSSCCYQIPALVDTEGADQQIDPRAILWKQSHKDGEQCNKCPFCIMFTAMHILYKLTSHVALLQVHRHPDQCTSEADKKDAITQEERARVFIPDYVRDKLPGGLYRGTQIMDDHFSLSGKIKCLDALLANIKRRLGRVLLFASSTQSLDLVQHYLASIGYSYRRMDGDTPMHKRTQIAEDYCKNPSIFVFLLSTKAMGLGLNLTAANNVIIYDCEWNPSYDQQAQDRAYRIGQKQDVKVYRLISRGTIEELKYLRQLYKNQLKEEAIVDVEASCSQEISSRMFRGVEGDTERRGELFGIANLMKYKDGEFLNYKKEKQRGVQVVNTRTIVSGVEKMQEAEMDELGGDALMEGFENSNETGEEEVESDMGGDSQAFMNIGDRAFFCPDDVSTIADEQATAAKGAQQTEKSRLNSPPKHRISIPSQDPTSPLTMESPQAKSRSRNAAIPRPPAPGRRLLDSGSHCTDSNTASGSEASASIPKRKARNFMIAGKSRDQIRRQTTRKLQKQKKERISQPS